MKFETKVIHSNFSPDPATRAVATPVFQTVAYEFANAQHGADLFDLKVEGNIYTRIMNPTCGVLESRVADLEGGIAGLCTSSGMAAITYAVQAISEAGSNIVSVSELYGGTYNLFAHTLPKQGIETRFAPHNDIDRLASLIDEKTSLVFCETVGNPLGNVCDIEKLAEAAHAAGVPLVVDNTVPTPWLWRPIEHGADIVIHSLTKYIGGHGTTIGGVIVDSGKFPWAKHAKRYPMLNQPDPSYHGVVYTEALGEAAFIGRCRVVPLRNTGSAMAPHSAFLLLQGLETLPLRMERHCTNAQTIAEHLQDHSQVKWVKYAGLPTSEYHDLAQKFMNGKASGILSFGVEGGRAAGEKLLDALKLFVRLVNIGDAKSLATHPASTTHRQLSDQELEQAGVTADMVRLSVGIEHVDDLIADLDQALAASQK
ncbi:MAG: aminotransferase class I/II-fold pyridoxal phosphate-dependent enzyme [Betaproteobacteria bacterium]|nr:aminotransferase class I/II-fold pyridoxal phosphate-dependent enzyme [Betaproteobacteria bacterium]